MKMIGMSVRSTATRFCRSRPLRPGRETSSTRQLGTRRVLDSSNIAPGHKKVANRSAPSKCGIECLKQSSVAEWLEQALHRPLFEHSWTNSLISVGGNEDDRNVLPAKLQFPLQIRSGHARHGDVEDQTSGLADAIGREELFRRRERAGSKAELPQQVG